MREFVRVVATTIIWIAFLIMMGALLSSETGAIARANSAALVGFMVVMAAAAFGFTFAVWHSGFDTGRRVDHVDEARSRLKQKRRSRRVEDLIESLNDDEVYELEALLLAQHADHDRRESGGR